MAGLLTRWLVCLSVGLALIPANVHTQDVRIPEISRRVTDLTGTLRSPEIRRLEESLAEFEKSTSNQVVVLLVPSLEGESLEEYSLKVCEKNKLGKKGRDNGVLLLIAKSDRKIRIEVGYGLEGALTDALSDQIIRHEIAPLFRSGDYSGGIGAGVEAIMAATKGEYEGEEGSGRKPGGLLPLFIAILMMIFFGRLFFAGRRMFIGRRGYWSGPWFGGFGGGGSGGGGFGGGFSGGGGSFGGGGASGSW